MGSGSMRAVLVGSDLSESSDDVIMQAAALRRQARAALHVVSAFQPSAASPGERDGVPPAVLEEVTGALAAQLRRILPPSDQPDSQVVRFDRAASAILRRAEEVDADVIVLGPHRGRDVRAHFLGTTADEVLRHSRTPCLVLRSPVPLPIRRIGVTTDLSELATVAVEEALAWSGRLGIPASAGEDERTRLCVAHVEAAVPDGSPDATAALDRLATRLAENGSGQGVDVGAEILKGRDVAATIVQWVERARLDLLVIGTRGESGWQRSVIGSVSSNLARSAPCAVLLVPRRREAFSAATSA